MSAKAPRFQIVLVMGKSGAGKQPRIDVLVKEYGLRQLSTGDMFRHYMGLVAASGFPGSSDGFWDPETGRMRPDVAIRELLAPYVKSHAELDGLVLGARARYYVDSGLFVPDELVNDIVDDAFGRLGLGGTVLDGYPRTVDQARHLKKLVDRAGTRIDLVVLVDNDDEAIVRRTVDRRICPKCKKVFHLQYKPPRDGRFCTKDGTEVVQRTDDTEANIHRRLLEYHEKVVPTLDYLRGLGVPVAVVPGNLPVLTDETVRASVLKAIAEVGL